jgi:serine phosphatase RsbU (regulator of sigma subunit)
MLNLMKLIATSSTWVVTLTILFLSLPASYVITSSYEALIYSQKMDELKELSHRKSVAIHDLTVNGSVMGGAQLVGVMNGILKKVAQGILPPDDPIARKTLKILVNEYNAGNAFVVNKKGVIVAYQRAKSNKSGTGTDVNFRPYFQQGIKGIPNVYAAVGTSTGKRGMYFAAPIHQETHSDSPIIGVVVIKIKPDRLDNLLGKHNGPALLLSPQKVTYSADTPDRLFHVSRKINKDLQYELNQYKQFGKMFIDQKPKALGFETSDSLVQMEGRQYAISTQPVHWNDPLGEWTLALLSDREKWFSKQAFASLGGVVFILFLVLFTMGFIALKGRYDNKIFSNELDEKRDQLASKSELLEAVLDSILQGMVAYDKDLKLIVCNQRFQTIRGVPDKFAQPGASFKEWMTHDLQQNEFNDRGPDDQIEFLAKRALEFTYHKFERTRPNGTIMEVEGGPLPGGGFVSTFTDITDRKKAERALKDAMEVISGSIQYASRIQQSTLPLEHNLDDIIPNRFIIWEPRDVVGGDMYWCRPWGEGHIVILGDCTGHGVPGAFMTLISNGVLGQAYREIEPGKPGLLLQRMHQLIQNALGQHLDQGESDDGLELGICYINPQNKLLLFSGARFELFVLEGEEITVVKGTKKGTGYRGIPIDQIYSETAVELRPGQRFYMTSDGIIDQVGGEKKRGFGKNRFKNLLLKNRESSFKVQKKLLLKALRDYQGAEKRRDDVSIVGFSLG